MKLTFFNALFNFNKANKEIENLTNTKNSLVTRMTKLEQEKSELFLENKRYKSVNTSLKNQIEDLNKIIKNLSESDIDINVTTTDNNINTDKNTSKEKKKNPPKK